MKNGKRNFALGAQKLIVAVTLVFCLIIFIGTIGLEETNIFTDVFSPAMRFLLLILLSGTICLLLTVFFHLVDSWNHRQLVIASLILFGIMALIFVFMLVNFECVPFTDALNVQDTALYFAESGVNTFSEDSPHTVYYGQYGNNNLMTICFAYFFRFLNALGIDSVYLPLSIVASVGILLATLFTYLIGIRIGGMRKSVKILVLCVLNPLYYLLVLWVYSTVLSIPLMMAVLYFGICAYQAKAERTRIIYCVLTVCISVIGYFIRPTVLIPFIALVCCAFVLFTKERKLLRRFWKSAVVCLLAGVLLFEGIEALNDSWFSSVSEKNFPITHWFMVASHGNAQNNNADTTFTRSFETKEEKTEATWQKTIENYESYSLPELAVFMAEKVMMNWSHGDGGDLYTRFSQETKQTSLTSWILGERSDFVRLYCYSYWLTTIFLLILTLVKMLKSKKLLPYSFLFALTFFGGLLFYLFWELKGTYSLPFLYVMLLLAEEGEEAVSERLSARNKKTRNRHTRFAVAAGLLCTFCLLVNSCYTMTHTDLQLHDYSVQSSPGLDSVEKISYESSLVLTQEFYVSKTFDTIVLAGKADKSETEEAVIYRFRLLNENGVEIYAEEISGSDISENGMITVRTGDVTPNGEEKYIVQIESEDNSENGIQFYQRDNYYLDMFKGTLTVNGETRQNDLWLQVYEEYTASWCPLSMGILLNGGWFLIICALSLALYRFRFSYPDH